MSIAEIPFLPRDRELSRSRRAFSLLPARGWERFVHRSGESVLVAALAAVIAGGCVGIAVGGGCNGPTPTDIVKATQTGVVDAMVTADARETAISASATRTAGDVTATQIAINAEATKLSLQATQTIVSRPTATPLPAIIFATPDLNATVVAGSSKERAAFLEPYFSSPLWHQRIDSRIRSDLSRLNRLPDLGQTDVQLAVRLAYGAFLAKLEAARDQAERSNGRIGFQATVNSEVFLQALNHDIDVVIGRVFRVNLS